MLIQATKIQKKYNDLEVVKGVNLSISKGEMVSIIGASGAGKSTLLHILGTLDKANSGELLIDNIDINKLSDSKLADFRNLNIGFVFQFHHLLPEFSAIENVCIPAWIAKRNKKQTENNAVKILERLGLKDKLFNKPNELSGGEQQRVAVARALINQPKVVFADEPTGNLDSYHAKELHHLFAELCAEFNQTFVIVTHNEELASLSHRVLKMKDGIIVN